MRRSATLGVSFAVTLLLCFPQHATTFTANAPRGGVSGAGFGRLVPANDIFCASRSGRTALRAVQTIEKERADVRDWNAIIADAAHEFSDTAHDMDDDSSYEERWRQRRIDELKTAPELTVDMVTDLFAPDALGRHRDINDPDQSYGAIFQLDGVVLQMTSLQQLLWNAVAAEFGLPPPSKEEVAMAGTLRPEMAVTRCFFWTMDFAEASKYALVHAQVQHRVLGEGGVANLPAGSGGSAFDVAAPAPAPALGPSPSLSPSMVTAAGIAAQREAAATGGRELRERPQRPERSARSAGKVSRWDKASSEQAERKKVRDALLRVKEQAGFELWVKKLRESNVPCAVVSSYPLITVQAALQAAGLWDDYFASDGVKSTPPLTLVTANDGYTRAAQLYLGAALRIARPPQKCAVFETSPSGVMGAHEADMRAVAVLGGSPHKPYELNVADLQVEDLSEMNLLSVRSLFADRVFPWDVEPQLELLPETKAKKMQLKSRWKD